MSRVNWYSPHPPACTCVQCNEGRKGVQQSGEEKRKPRYGTPVPPRPPAGGRPPPMKGGSGRSGWVYAVVIGLVVAGVVIWAVARGDDNTDPTPTAAPLEELWQYALQLINKDRADHGVAPVALGANPAAQMHAEDMLRHDYFGHWWLEGYKPYMVYTTTGGTSYAAENVTSDGWTDVRWREENCDSFFVRCETPKLRKSISELEWAMMYDDAHADWGHRDNILDEGHRAVNIGIAYNKRRVVFVQHFEGGDVVADGPPSLASDGTLSFSLSKKRAGTDIGGEVTIYYDPPPTPMTAAEIDALDSYCIGGGASGRCGDSIADVVEPLPPDWYYSDLPAQAVIADEWVETETSFSFRASVSHLLNRAGVYTVVVWRDSGGDRLEDVLVELSVIKSG